MYADPVDIDLARHHAAMDADEAFDTWMQERKQEQAAVAEKAMTAPAIWDWVDDAETMRTTKGVPYTVEEILIAALNKSEEARTEYAELMASPEAENCANCWQSTGHKRCGRRAPTAKSARP